MTYNIKMVSPKRGDRPPCSTPPTFPRSTTQVWKGIEEVLICDGLTKKGRISWMCKHYQPKSNEFDLNLWEQPKSTESLVKCEEKKLLCHLQVPSLLFSRTVSNLYLPFPSPPSPKAFPLRTLKSYFNTVLSTIWNHQFTSIGNSEALIHPFRWG